MKKIDRDQEGCRLELKELLLTRVDKKY